MESQQPKITTTITCMKCGGAITGGDREYIVRCPFCGAEYQISISAVAVEPADVNDRIRTLVACAVDGNPRESGEACLELAKIKDARIVAPIIAALIRLWSDMDNYEKNGPAIGALGDILKNISDPAAAGVLNDALRNERTNIRQLAAFALRNIGDPSSAGPLMEAARDADQYVRCAALEALGSINDNRIPEVLMAALKDDNYSIKISAIRALGDLRCREAADIILGIFKEYSITRTDNGVPWVVVRSWAANALGKIGYEQAVTSFIKALNDDDGDVRKAADAALMYIGSATKDESLKERIKKARKIFETENPR